MNLSPVSRTAILTLICRAVAAETGQAEFTDPMAVLCLDQLIASCTGEDLRWLMREKRIYSGLEKQHAIQGTRRSQVFDRITNRFISENPGCSVINLACGFDTRFWRIDHARCTFIDLDLPEVVQLKQEILGDLLTYPAIGVSVLDSAWIDRVTREGNSAFLLIAEGLFAWLNEADAIALLKSVSSGFQNSRFVLDILPRQYTRGLWKFLQRLDARIGWGLDVAWASGICDPQDIETRVPGLRITASEKGSAGPILTVSVNTA